MQSNAAKRPFLFPVLHFLFWSCIFRFHENDSFLPINSVITLQLMSHVTRHEDSVQRFIQKKLVGVWPSPISLPSFPSPFSPFSVPFPHSPSLYLPEGPTPVSNQLGDLGETPPRRKRGQRNEKGRRRKTEKESASAFWQAHFGAFCGENKAFQGIHLLYTL